MKEGMKKHGWVAALILANQDTRINTADQHRINLYVDYKQIKDHRQKIIVITELNFIYSLWTSFSLYVSGRLSAYTKLNEVLGRHAELVEASLPLR